MKAVTWSQAEAGDPELFEHAARRLGAGLCYLSTVRPDGWPRVHPIGALVPEAGSLRVGMLPTSPKGHDLQRNGRYAVHCAVEDSYGGGGEVLMTGLAEAREPGAYHSQRGWVSFELLLGELLTTSYDKALGSPVSRRWNARYHQT
jgi:hypothetical protein